MFVGNAGGLFWNFLTGALAGKRIATTMLVNSKGDAMNSLGGTEAHIIADGIGLLGNAASTPVSDIPGGEYILDIQWSGSASGIQIQARAADGVTWRNGPTLNAPGAIEVKIGDGAEVRLKNVDATNAATSVFARIS